MLLRIKQMKIGTPGILAFLIIAFATLVRILLIALGWPHSNADEGTMGIMAMHIASHGEHPIFFYGQYYMGTLEAYLGVFFFHLFGVSLFALRLGPVLFFALFLTCMYFLTSLLYTKTLAVLTLLLLSLGSSIMLDTEVVALGGYPELLFFGAFSFLLACWLALTCHQYASSRRKLWRLMAYGCWGLVAGVGFWSDFLMLVFILVSGLVLLLFCWRELLKVALLPLVLGLVLGSLPLIIYNLHASSGENTLAVLRYLHNNGNLQLAQLRAHDPIPFGPQLRGTLLTTIPAAIGGSPFCFDAYTHFRLAGYLGTENVSCSIAHGDWRLIGTAFLWSFGLILLWLIATFLTLRHLWKILNSNPEQVRKNGEKQALIREFARLMLLFSVTLTLYFFVSSPISATFPTTSRYLIGLLIATPALIAPLWGLLHAPRPTSHLAHSEDKDRANALQYSFALNVSTLQIALRRGILLILGIIFLVGTIQTFLEIPTVRAYTNRDEILMHDLAQLKISHFSSDYWTCDSLIFYSKEHLICSSVDNALRPHYNRYLPYVALVKADPRAAYVFPIGASQLPSMERKVTQSARHYQRFVMEGYIIYLPVQSSSQLSPSSR